MENVLEMSIKNNYMGTRRSLTSIRIDQKIHYEIEDHIDTKSDIRHIGAVMYSHIYERLGYIVHLQVHKLGANKGTVINTLKADVYDIEKITRRDI